MQRHFYVTYLGHKRDSVPETGWDTFQARPISGLLSVILVQEQNQVVGHIENMKIQFYMHQNIIISHYCNHKGNRWHGNCCSATPQLQSVQWKLEFSVKLFLVKRRINLLLKIISMIKHLISTPWMEITVEWIQKGVHGHKHQAQIRSGSWIYVQNISFTQNLHSIIIICQHAKH